MCIYNHFIGWWLARYQNKEGWVPSNYLEEYKPPTLSRPPPPPAPRRPMSQNISASPSTAPSNTVPAWKAQLAARNSSVNGITSSANRPSPPTIASKPSIPNKPSIPSRPVSSGISPPAVNSQATSLADAVSFKLK